jgi:hypothetical protein
MASHSFSSLFITLGIQECNISPLGEAAIAHVPAVDGLDSGSLHYKYSSPQLPSGIDLYHCLRWSVRVSL